MSTIDLLILQLISHLITDYVLQSHKLACDKNSLGFKSSFLPWHGVIAFLTALTLSFHMSFIYGALIIGTTHYVFDGLKVYLNRDKRWSPYAFFIDQFLHLLVIACVVFVYTPKDTTTNDFPALTTKHLLIWLAYLACSKPANIFIKQIFDLFEIKIVLVDELPNAGKLIGTLERWLILTFIIANHFEAVGFLIAAKSILRFKNDDTIRSEYVLIGTMLSFGIAVIFGLIING